VRKRKEVLSIRALIRRSDRSRELEDLLDTRCDRRSHDIVCVLAQCAIRMCHPVRVDVRKLDCCAKKEKDRKKRNEQVASLFITQPYFAEPSHS
jgi:hypothetical protein